MVTATPKSPAGLSGRLSIERRADAHSRLLRSTNATTRAEAHADFGALRGAESAAVPRYYTHGTTREWKGDRTDLVAEVFPTSRFEFVRNAAAIQLHIDGLQGKLVRGDAVDGAELARLTTIVTRLLAQLGRGRQAGPIAAWV